MLCYDGKPLTEHNKSAVTDLLFSYCFDLSAPDAPTFDRKFYMSDEFYGWGNGNRLADLEQYKRNLVISKLSKEQYEEVLSRVTQLLSFSDVEIFKIWYKKYIRIGTDSTRKLLKEMKKDSSNLFMLKCRMQLLNDIKN